MYLFKFLQDDLLYKLLTLALTLAILSPVGPGFPPLLAIPPYICQGQDNEMVPGWVWISVRPKPGFGIGNRNQDQVSVSGPELFCLNLNFL